jgi:CBS domain containing-hemolysin-like protein
MSGYFSATETAMSTFNKTRMKTLAEKGNKRASLALDLSEHYDTLLSTILIGNNLVNILLTAVCTVFFIDIAGSNDLGTTLSTVVSTIAVLIFGEITPKNIAKDRPEKFAMFSAPIINALIFLLTPFNFLFSLWRKLVLKIFKAEEESKMSQEELLMLVEEIQQDGSIDEEESTLLQNAIEFTERKAEDILTHRVDIEGVSRDATKEKISSVFQASRFSRLVVYDETIDNITGVIHQKDFYTESGIFGGNIEEIITPPVFTQKSEKISDLLKLLQKNKSHIAVVLDEYGGTFGIVTMEDILEELVGDIWDEHDEVEKELEKLEDDNYRIDCTMNLSDFCENFEINVESDNISVGGWVMEELGKIPEVGDTFSFEELDITVTETEFQRVLFINVRCNKVLKADMELEDEGSVAETV